MSSDAPRPAASPLPPPSATPPPAAAKKRAKRAPKDESAGAPAPKRPKKTEAVVEGAPTVAKKTSTRKKKENEETEEQQVVSQVEQERRRAAIEAEEQELDSQDEDAEGDSWEDKNISRNQESYRVYGQKLTTLYHMMTPEQKERYTKYRGSGITEGEIKEHILDPLRMHASSEATTVLRAIGKVFVGELMDKAIQVMQQWNDTGNVRPVHLREAHRQIELAGELPSTPKTLKFGRPR